MTDAVVAGIEASYKVNPPATPLSVFRLRPKTPGRSAAGAS